MLNRLFGWSMNVMVMELRHHSDVFWYIMLPASIVLAPTFSAMTQFQAQVLRSDPGERPFQTTLYLALAFAIMGIASLRILITRAIEARQLGRVVLLTLISLSSSFAMITYGVSALGWVG